MIPAVFVPLDALPLTANGKLDRGALPQPDVQRPELAANFSPPQTAMERQIAGLWQEVLQLEQVGIFDNFFDLGGDSLKLARLHHKLGATLNQQIAMLDMFKHTTIHALAKYLDKPKQAPAQPSFQTFRDRAQKQKAALSRQTPIGNPRKKTDG
jgi:acyl carrier protein